MQILRLFATRNQETEHLIAGEHCQCCELGGGLLLVIGDGDLRQRPASGLFLVDVQQPGRGHQDDGECRLRGIGLHDGARDDRLATQRAARLTGKGPRKFLLHWWKPYLSLGLTSV